MAALILASARACSGPELGPETPEAELAGVALDLAAAAVGVSVPVTSRGPATAGRLARLCRLLPPGMPLIAGGTGAPRRARPGIQVMAEIGAWHGGCGLPPARGMGSKSTGHPEGRGGVTLELVIASALAVFGIRTWEQPRYEVLLRELR